MNDRSLPPTQGLNFPPELVIGVVVGQQLFEKFIGGGVKGGGEELHVMLVEEREEGHEGGGEDSPEGGLQLGHVGEQVRHQGGGNRAPVIPLSGNQTKHPSQGLQILIGRGGGQKVPEKSQHNWNSLVG